MLVTPKTYDTGQHQVSILLCLLQHNNELQLLYVVTHIMLDATRMQVI